MISLREARTKSKKTQEEVARAANVTLRYYAKVEKGESIPTVAVGLKICRYLSIDINDVAEWQPSSTTSETKREEP